MTDIGSWANMENSGQVLWAELNLRRKSQERKAGPRSLPNRDRDRL